MKCKQRMEELITSKLMQGFSLDVIADRLGMDVEELRGIKGRYNSLARLEKQIWEMQL
jgi:hypothetical protein